MSKWNQRCWYEYIVSGHKWTTHAIAGNSTPPPLSLFLGVQLLKCLVKIHFTVWIQSSSLRTTDRCGTRIFLKFGISSILSIARVCDWATYHQPPGHTVHLNEIFSLNKRQQLLLSLRFPSSFLKSVSADCTQVSKKPFQKLTCGVAQWVIFSTKKRTKVSYCSYY